MKKIPTIYDNIKGFKKTKREITSNIISINKNYPKTSPEIIAASKTSMSRNSSILPAVNSMKDSSAQTVMASQRSTKVLDLRGGAMDWSRGNIDLLARAAISVLPLDLVPNAEAGYSLRKLRTDYSGAAILVRNASNVEIDIEFIGNELDTATLLTHCGGGDGFVVTWYDQSLNGNDVTNASATGQPSIVLSGAVNLLNSKSCINFDGSNDYLTMGVGSSLDYSSNNIFSFSVNESASTDGRIWADDIIGTQGYTINRPYLSPNGVFVNDGNGYEAGNTTAATLGGQSLNTYSLIGASGLSDNRQNGTSYNSLTIAGWGGTIGTSGTAGFSIGSGADGGQEFEGNQQELIIYTSDKSASVTVIESDIINYYSIS